MNHYLHNKCLPGRLFFPGITVVMAACLLFSCKQRGQQVQIDESAFVFRTEYIDGDAADYSRSAVITGHIANREVYPNTKEISITIPFYDRVSDKQTSAIYDDCFAFSLVPYAPRTISMQPYVEHMVVCPGDSIHVELDFANLAKVVYSGKGAENNEKYNDFHMGYYLSKDWPGFSQWDRSAPGQPKRLYEHADVFAAAAKEKLGHHLSRLEDFIEEKRPSPELIVLCRKEIEADYFSVLIQGLVTYKSMQGEVVSAYFDITDAEHLFNNDCMSGNLFELSSNISLWLISSFDREEIIRLAKDFPARIDLLRKSTKNEMLRQMLISHFYNQLLEGNEVALFEEYFDSFNENVTYPLLKLSTRDRYVLKKAYQQNPKTFSDAILKADQPHDGQSIVLKENEGLKLLRSVIAKEEGKVVHITIGATWCPGVRQEIPFQRNLAADYQGKPLRVVNFYMDDGANDMESTLLGIETFHLTDAQRVGLDPILHLGRGIPFYILIDKEGVIVDFGGHLRASIPETRDKIDEYLDDYTPSL